MSNDECASAQVKKFDSSLDWRPLDREDRKTLMKQFDAEFILRSWRRSDDRYGHQEASLLDMVLITIVFRAGCRTVMQYCPALGEPMRRAYEYADYMIGLYPQLAGGVS